MRWNFARNLRWSVVLALSSVALQLLTVEFRSPCKLFFVKTS